MSSNERFLKTFKTVCGEEVEVNVSPESCRLQKCAPGDRFVWRKEDSGLDRDYFGVIIGVGSCPNCTPDTSALWFREDGKKEIQFFASLRGVVFLKKAA